MGDFPHHSQAHARLTLIYNQSKLLNSRSLTNVPPVLSGSSPCSLLYSPVGVQQPHTSAQIALIARAMFRVANNHQNKVNTQHTRPILRQRYTPAARIPEKATKEISRNQLNIYHLPKKSLATLSSATRTQPSHHPTTSQYGVLTPQNRTPIPKRPHIPHIATTPCRAPKTRPPPPPRPRHLRTRRTS
jgi:hypothetical protein